MVRIENTNNKTSVLPTNCCCKSSLASTNRSDPLIIQVVPHRHQYYTIRHYYVEKSSRQGRGMTVVINVVNIEHFPGLKQAVITRHLGLLLSSLPCISNLSVFIIHAINIINMEELGIKRQN